MPICTVAGCSSDAVARGWCVKHYGRHRRNGDVEMVKPRGGFCQSNCQCGRHEQSEDHRRKISEGLRGRPVAEGTRQKISVTRVGQRNGGPAIGQFEDPGGYVRLTMEHDHPLASRVGHVKRARKVLYEKIGPGQHSCHWSCGAVLAWGGGNGICADHLDGDTSNDDPENLVPSCNPCNAKRARAGNPIEWSA